MKITGVTFARNAIKFDYPISECLQALSLLCDEVVYVLGKSDDGTESLPLPPNVHVVHTVWDENLRKGGQILSEQTNIGLEEAFRRGADWCVVLQADELLHERDFPKIRAVLEKTDKMCASFRYLHFWQRFDQVAVSPRWYAQEIRAVRNGMLSFGDAQTFRGSKGEVVESELLDAFVYHYGHVRDPKAYEYKKQDFHRWWHSDSEMKRRHDRKEPVEELIPFHGSHPSTMMMRILRLQGERLHASHETLWLWDSHPPADLPYPVRVLKNANELPRKSKVAVVDGSAWVELRARLKGNIVIGRSMFASIRIPDQMKSPQAKPWPKDFYRELVLNKGLVCAKNS